VRWDLFALTSMTCGLLVNPENFTVPKGTGILLLTHSFVAVLALLLLMAHGQEALRRGEVPTDLL
jgi:hypothetical protein